MQLLSSEFIIGSSPIIELIMGRTPLSEFIIGRSPFFFFVILFLIGIHGLLTKQNLVKKLIGMNIMQAAVILFFIIQANKWNATVPIRSEAIGNAASSYMNPIPHALMLTAIVVSVATTGVALSLLIRIYQNYRSLDEPKLLDKIKEGSQ